LLEIFDKLWKGQRHFTELDILCMKSVVRDMKDRYGYATAENGCPLSRL
jgi:hypothetical protein